MKNQISFGVNRTGIQMSPFQSKQMEAGFKDFPPMPVDTSMRAADLKQTYIREADSVGSVPLPGSVHGAVTTGVQMIKGERPEMLMDKLSERLAFERTGVRLYEALIMKAEVALPGNALSDLHQFRNEEEEHFVLVRDVIESLGGDATSQTPCADVAGMAAMGLMQVLTDPRTNLAQCVQAILIAELADNDAWDLLIQLTEDAGLEGPGEKFRLAKAQEDLHLEYMRSWIEDLVLEPEKPLQH